MRVGWITARSEQLLSLRVDQTRDSYLAKTLNLSKRPTLFLAESVSCIRVLDLNKELFVCIALFKDKQVRISPTKVVRLLLLYRVDPFVESSFGSDAQTVYPDSS